MLRIRDSVLRGDIDYVECMYRQIEMREGMVVRGKLGDALHFCEAPQLNLVASRIQGRELWKAPEASPYACRRAAHQIDGAFNVRQD